MTCFDNIINNEAVIYFATSQTCVF